MRYDWGMDVESLEARVAELEKWRTETIERERLASIRSEATREKLSIVLAACSMPISDRRRSLPPERPEALRP